jgi:hypothetical protein
MSFWFDFSALNCDVKTKTIAALLGLFDQP